MTNVFTAAKCAYCKQVEAYKILCLQSWVAEPCLLWMLMLNK